MGLMHMVDPWYHGTAVEHISLNDHMYVSRIDHCM